MKTLAATAVALTITAAFATASFAASAANTLLLETKTGTVVIELLPDVAPAHVERIRNLANSGFYDGLKFHRVIEGFMAQTGDPLGNGTGGSDLPDLGAEFSNLPYVRGVLGMARSSSPNSANSQFFIMFDTASSLNGQYTVFGRVTDGMEHVDKIKKGSRSRNGSVSNPDTILQMRTADQ
ncbi:MAG: peptidylprolyl isomerase [Hyphomicrobiales bacterium]|nr:MAG: peptidylprolyl isomerase [Hyphomicrobiales bacterium]